MDRAASGWHGLGQRGGGRLDAVADVEAAIAALTATRAPSLSNDVAGQNQAGPILADL